MYEVFNNLGSIDILYIIDQVIDSIIISYLISVIKMMCTHKFQLIRIVMVVVDIFYVRHPGDIVELHRMDLWFHKILVERMG